MRLAARLGVLLAVAGCGGAAARGFDGQHRAAPAGAALREPGLHAPDDPTVHGARLVPVSLQEAHEWGSEPGGARRAVVAGLRILSSPGGDATAAPDRLPGGPTVVVEIPERLGGGFLMAVGPHLWRCASWLDTAVPIFTMVSPITEIFVGLDRVYLRAAQGPLVAIDPRTGGGLDLGPLPSSPRVVSVAALDAWRAVAVADLRGALLTVDAGSSWRPVSLPIEPVRVVARDGVFAIAGLDRSRALQWWEVMGDGQTDWLAPPPPAPARTGTSSAPEPATPFGGRPLLAAIEDGWPLTDGTALVARDGSLTRVRLADGAVVEAVPDAFPLRAARCHPLSLARDSEHGAFGFVCGEPRGSTVVFRWDAPGSRLVELRRFETPREVVASGNGALAVRGGCASPEDTRADARAWCLMAPNGAWTEMHFSGAAVDRARLVVLSNGGVALVRPPEEGDLASARLTLTDGATDGAHATHEPLRFDPVPADVARALRMGVWMDGFEERRPGVLGGWIDAAGSILGVEIALDGAVHVGEYIRDAGGPVASGRWAFGWTVSRGGFESTDGGMSWTKEIELPDPIAEPRSGRARSCGPIGCVSAGWLRVGWGPGAGAPEHEPPPPRSRGTRRPPPLNLDCDPPGAAPAREGTDTPPEPPVHRPFVTGRAASSASVSEFRPFAGRAGPTMAPGDLGVSIDASHPFERGLRPRPIARAYVWGPGAGDWDPPGHWQVRWFWPWSGPTGNGGDARSSAASPAPWANLEAAARALGASSAGMPEWTLVPGDDPDHALLIERRAGLVSNLAGSLSTQGTSAAAILETDRAPIEVKRAGGELLPDLQGAVRTGGRWYLATSQVAGEPGAVVVWLLDGGVARELGRVPRVAPEAEAPARLARRIGGAVGGDNPSSPIALAVMAADSERVVLTWIASFDPEAHTFADPMPLAPVDLSDRAIAACSGADAGWELDASLPGTVDVRIGTTTTRLQGVLARLRLSRTTACVSGIFGSADAPPTRLEGPGPVPRGAAAVPASSHTLNATMIGEHGRVRLQCRVVSP